VTWAEYGEGLEGRISDLHGRIQRGAYQAQPSRRVWIPKPDGRQRPLEIAALEDKIVQHAVGRVLNQIWEEDFQGFSYGFRPGRNQHDALDALSVGILRKKVLGARSGRPVILRQSRTWMAGKVRRASDSRPTDRAPDPEMVEGGRDGGWPVVRDEGRDPAGIGDHSPNAKDNFEFERTARYRHK